MEFIENTDLLNLIWGIQNDYKCDHMWKGQHNWSFLGQFHLWASGMFFMQFECYQKMPYYKSSYHFSTISSSFLSHFVSQSFKIFCLLVLVGGDMLPFSLLFLLTNGHMINAYMLLAWAHVLSKLVRSNNYLRFFCSQTTQCWQKQIYGGVKRMI